MAASGSPSNTRVKPAGKGDALHPSADGLQALGEREQGVLVDAGRRDRDERVLALSPPEHVEPVRLGVDREHAPADRAPRRTSSSGHHWDRRRSHPPLSGRLGSRLGSSPCPSGTAAPEWCRCSGAPIPRCRRVRSRRRSRASIRSATPEAAWADPTARSTPGSSGCPRRRPTAMATEATQQRPSEASSGSRGRPQTRSLPAPTATTRDDAEHRHRDVAAMTMSGIGREVLLEASPAIRGRGIDARRAAVERVAQRSFEVMGPAHGSITSRSWESPRWSSDLTVPGRHPSATAMSASDKSS